MGNQYGTYAMYFLSQLLKQREDEARKSSYSVKSREPGIASARELPGLFAYDETGSVWHRETGTELLRSFCPEGCELSEKYGHFIIGEANDGCYIGIPGRFLCAEQPAAGKSGFTLWQPIKGGEAFYSSLDEMQDELADCIYGYWIAALDRDSLRISEA